MAPREDSDTATVQTINEEAPARGHSGQCVLGPFSSRFNILEVEKVEWAAKGGCRACAGVQRFVKTLGEPIYGFWLYPVLPGLGHQDNLSRPHFMVKSGDGEFQCEFFSVRGIHDPVEQRLDSFEQPNSSSGHPMIRTMRIPSGDTSSTKAFSTLKRWISQCQTHHSQCDFTGERTLPHRVLQIESLQPLRVRVLEDCSRRESYACLSHRWAESETRPKSLTTQNLELYKAGIPQDRFYPLVRDAITAAFRLDLRFIWIDCYCILQDDEKDWEREAACMASIYEHAFLTISATSSENGRGMFSVAPPDSLGVQITDINGEVVFARKRLNHPCETTIFDRDALSGASLIRGWVFQERLLSNRFIHFTTDEIFWECRESTWCECSSRQEEWAYKRANTARALRNQKWEDIAAQYNQTHLSFEKDRLPALAGVAKGYGEEHMKTYLAGSWKEDLPRTLAWKKSQTEDDPHVRPLHQNTPTWSWITLPRGKLIFDDYAPNTSVRVLNCVRKPPHADIYAGANRTEITLEGPILDMRIFAHQQHKKDKIVGSTDNAFIMMHPDFNMKPRDPTKCRAVPPGTSCSLLILSRAEDPQAQERCFGILLVRVNNTDSSTAVFERIGFLDAADMLQSHLVEPGKFADYRGGELPPGVNGHLPMVSVEWLLRKAETRRVTII